MPRLQVLNGKRQGAIFEVKLGNEHIIGHRPSAAITIDDPWVSWDHAKLFFNKEDGACWIEDLGSTNGTYVNCVRVKRECLRHEDIVFLGKTHVIFLCPAEEHSGGRPFELDDPVADLLPTASPAQGGMLISSEAGPFGESGLTPLRAMKEVQDDPLAQPPGTGRQPKPRDPFADSGVDPFSSGPDYSTGPSQRGPVAPGYTISLEASAEKPQPAPSPGLRSKGPFAETNADERNPYPAGGSQRGLDLERIVEPEEEGGARPSHQEISRLLDGYDDLDAILGEDGRALTPSPREPLPTPGRAGRSTAALRGPGSGGGAFGTGSGGGAFGTGSGGGAFGTGESPGGPRPPGPGGSSARLPRDLSQVPASEMRTALQVDAGAVAQILADDDDLYATKKPPAAGPPPPPPDAPPTRPGTATAPPPPPPAPAPGPTPAMPMRAFGATPAVDDLPGGLPRDLSQLAFDRARLEDEVRRLRAALQAATQKDPQAVKLAAQALRDQELGRLARRVAELEQEVVRLRQDLTGKETELNQVTEEMIDKEDAIESLQSQLDTLRGGTDPRTARSSAGKQRPHGLSASDELDDLGL